MSETRPKAYTRPEHFGISNDGRITIEGADGPDREGRWPAEPIGFHLFAWLPKRCRNGKVRWLRWVEHHDDGTFTLSDRCG